jgi:putative ABC transport system ATP-binding protein
MGPSGSGKTTLFNMIGGLDRPTQGRVFIDEVEISRLDAYELAWLRCHKVGYIFQTFNLLPVLTALENVSLPMIFAGTPRKERDKKAAEILNMVGLEKRLQHRPSELSAGQQQRVALARALANDPSIILADEPTGNLDFQTGHEIIQLLRNINKERGVTIIAATHDLKIIDVSDSVIYMRDGKVEKIDDRQ